MTESDDNKAAADPSGPGKPCLALMGEFSAGKSTLTNLLIGSQSLPVQVTATQLPPVWIVHGDQPPYRVDLEGNVMPVDLNHIDEVDIADTAYVRIFRKSDVLEICDIIDMPGISDPSMAANIWQRVIHNATSVVWCTHATQAWRQSEAAVWDSLPPALHEKSLLLLTRMDKINSGSDRERLLRRVRRETDGLPANPAQQTLPVAAGIDLVHARQQKKALFMKCGRQAVPDSRFGLAPGLRGVGAPDNGGRIVDHPLPDICRHRRIGNARHVDDVADLQHVGLPEDADIGGVRDIDLVDMVQIDGHDVALEIDPIGRLIAMDDPDWRQLGGGNLHGQRLRPYQKVRQGALACAEFAHERQAWLARSGRIRRSLVVVALGHVSALVPSCGEFLECRHGAFQFVPPGFAARIAKRQVGGAGFTDLVEH